MRVLVAGASGYIGGKLSSYLADAGFEIIALCNNNVPTDHSWQKKMHLVLKADVSISSLTQQLDVTNLDAVINLISLDHNDSNGNPDFVNSVNVTSGWNLLDTFLKKGLKKYIYFSTIHVYGNKLAGNIDEDHSLNPINKYGLTHLLSEKVVNYYANNTDLDCTIIRLSNGYGSPTFMSNKCWDLIINNLCLGVWKNQKIVLNSDGSPLRDFIHISDILQGVKQLLQNPPPPIDKAQILLIFHRDKQFLCWMQRQLCNLFMKQGIIKKPIYI